MKTFLPGENYSSERKEKLAQEQMDDGYTFKFPLNLPNSNTDQETGMEKREDRKVN